MKKEEKYVDINSGQSIYQNFKIVDISNKIGEENHENKFNIFKTFKKTHKFAMNSKFNNGEPAVSAIKKSFKDVIILAIVFCVVWLAFIGVQFIKTYITNDTYINFTMSSKYEKELETDWSVSDEPNSAYAVLQFINETAVDTDDNFEFVYVRTLYEQLKSVPEIGNVTMKSNMSNSEMLEYIYLSMQDDLPVIVCMSDVNEGYLQYAIVQSIAPHSSRIEVYYMDGTSEVMSLDSFVEKTRYTDVERKRFDFAVGLTAGIYNINTLIFMDDYTEDIEDETAVDSE